MSVATGGGNSNHLKWTKAIKKVNKQAHRKIKENVGMNWRKKYRDMVGIGVCSGTTIMSNIHKTHLHTYPYM